MKTSITYATLEDISWLKKQDTHVSERILKRKAADKEILIAKENNKPIGWLRFGFFWDEIPFMNMLVVEKKYRNKGIGKKLVQYWEEEMKKKKHKLVMTSSLCNEEAQLFYRKLGYADAGALLLPKEPLEVIFIKKLK